MSGKPTPMGVLLLSISMTVGGFASAALTHRLTDGVTGTSLLPVIPGVVFAALGWFLAENIGEAIVFLFFTGVMGGVALIFLQSETLRIVVIAFLCGFNIGKLAGGVYREFR